MLKTYEVTIDGFPPVVFSATSPGKARADAWRSYTNAYECSFRDFLKISRIARCDVPADDGYGYVRRAYSVDPKVGQRVRLRNEGPNNGLEGVVGYPGTATAHVHILLDGYQRPVRVHPDNFEPIH